MNKLKIAALALSITGLTSQASFAGAFLSNFNNNNGLFNAAEFLFTNEKGMNVLYQKKWLNKTSNKVRLRAGRRTGKGAFGVWFQTREILPSGALAVARCRIVGGSKYNWAGFWTLYERRTSINSYFEQDVMETYPLGNFINRYTQRNPTTNQVVVGRGELNTFKGARFFNWRKNWRNYQVNWGDTSSTFKILGNRGLTKVISGRRRAGVKQKMLLVNRPWGPNINKLRNWTDIGTFECDFANAWTP